DPDPPAPDALVGVVVVVVSGAVVVVVALVPVVVDAGTADTISPAACACCNGAVKSSDPRWLIVAISWFAPPGLITTFWPGTNQSTLPTASGANTFKSLISTRAAPLCASADREVCGYMVNVPPALPVAHGAARSVSAQPLAIENS